MVMLDGIGGVSVFMAGLLLVACVVQEQRIPRWRWIAAIGLIVAALAVGLSADDGETVIGPCLLVEKYSAEWWFLGCWYLDLLG